MRSATAALGQAQARAAANVQQAQAQVDQAQGQLEQALAGYDQAQARADGSEVSGQASPPPAGRTSRLGSCQG